MQLAALQQKFIEALRRKQLSAPLQATVAQQAEPRFSLYIRNFYGGLAETLALTFPATAALVGKPFFRSMIQAFAKNHPPASGNLDEYGSRLPEFIRSFSPAASLPYLTDIARFEWLCHRVLLADEPLTLEPSALTAYTPKTLLQLRLPLHPARALFTSPYPVQRICEFTKAPEGTLDISGSGASLLLSRHAFELHIATLDPAEYHWLAALSEGKTLGEACEAALTDTAVTPPDFAHFIQKHLQSATFLGS